MAKPAITADENTRTSMAWLWRIMQPYHYSRLTSTDFGLDHCAGAKGIDGKDGRREEKAKKSEHPKFRCSLKAPLREQRQPVRIAWIEFAALTRNKIHR